MEHLEGISLLQHIKAQDNRWINEEAAKSLWKELVKGLSYLHSKNITHRDIKLENVLLSGDKKSLKLIDFGFSTCVLPTRKLKIYCGTPSYMSPQIVSKKEYYGPPADIWASGVLLYAMLEGQFPFKGTSDRDLYKKICKGKFRAPNASLQCRMLLEKVLKVDAGRRITAEEILADPWMTGEEVDE